ncbi:DUF1579 family protein [Kordiimonas aquimaris]|uniref:DUF1579 family protein n=1 Tax=Kordiimonas aquimaris TaxID=707591 RepID=UPI0021D136A9|nr:DUF1579 family protein [Kordiimonas aquimaris]
MKKIYTLLTIIIGFCLPSTAQDSVPEVSKAPLAAMAKLSPIMGEWQMTAEYSADDGKTWQEGSPEKVSVAFRQKGMVLRELPLETDKPGFHTETYIGYDQYRNVYRLIAFDDVWGLPDVYEGTIEDNKLIVTNLKSGSLFKMGDDLWRGFKITIELKANNRVMTVDKTDDMGKSWQPNFRITYAK